MILPPPLLSTVSTAFLKFFLIDFNLAETRSFVFESKSLLRRNFSSSTSGYYSQNFDFICSYFVRFDSQFTPSWSLSALKSKHTSRRRWIPSSVQLKSDAFRLYFLPSWLAIIPLMLHKNQTNKKLPKIISFAIRTLPVIYSFIWYSNMYFLIKVSMVEDISENHHNVHTRYKTSNGNSTFRIKTNY